MNYLKTFFDFFDNLKNHLFNKYALLIPIGIGCIYISALFFSTNFASANAIQNLIIKVCFVLIIVVLACLMIVIFVQKFPRFKPDSINIVFAIKTHSINERKQIEEKLIEKIRQRFTRSFNYNYSIYFLNPYQTEKMLDILEKAKLTKSMPIKNVNLAFWGICESGYIKKQSVIRIDLQGMVTHDKLLMQISKMLSMDMSYVMEPIREMVIYNDDDIFQFDEKAGYISIISKYILASALFYSAHFLDSYRYYLELKNSINTGFRSNKMAARLKHPIIVKCGENCHILSQIEYKAFRESGEISHLDNMANYLEERNNYVAIDEAYNIGMSIYFFCKERNIRKAREYLKNNKSVPLSAISRLNDIFLKFYQKYTPYSAFNSYRRYMDLLKKVSYETRIEIEEFIIWVLEKEPDKYHLNWLLCIIICYRGDSILSIRYLETFLNTDNLELNSKLEEAILEIRNMNDK